MARSLPINQVAPYFIDAEAAPEASVNISWPRAGLTVINFPNNHRGYLITWYLLALMVLIAACLAGRDEWRRRTRADSTG